VSWSFVAGGLLGSFTTVSSLSLHTLELARERAFVGAGANVVLSLVIGLAAVSAGFAIGQLLAGAAA
jgi:CrcB protein